MRKYLYFFLCLCYIIPLSGTVAQQNIFYVNVHPQLVNEDGRMLSGYYLKINDVILGTYDTLAVRSHYPALDTIYYSYADDSLNHVIITRFSPGKFYSVVDACCGTFDLVERERADRYMNLMHDYDANVQTIQNEFLDRVKVRFAPVPGGNSENILGVFAEFSGFPFGIQLGTSFSRYYLPSKGFFWNNVTEIWIMKPLKEVSFVSGDKRKTEDVWPENGEVLASLRYRFFGDAKVTLAYQPGKEIQVLLE